MTSSEEHLARTLIDILGEAKVVEIVGTQRLAAALAGLELEQCISLLRTLMAGLSEQELKGLMNQSTTQSNEAEAKPEGHIK